MTEETQVHEMAFVRRFETADLQTHGPWILERLKKANPDLDERRIAGWVAGLQFSNDHMFLYQDAAVALFQIVSAPGIRNYKIVQEMFVWARDKDGIEDAADFYVHAQVWAQRQSAERLIVAENSDVPKAKIEERLGRLFDTKVTHARV